MSLKTKNLWFIMQILVFDAVAILPITHGYNIFDLFNHQKIQFFQLNSGLKFAIIPLLALLLNHLLPSEFKATIIYWKLKDALPGCQAFSKHVYKDLRIDAKILKKRFGKFPSTGKMQNVLWFKFFKRHESKIEIQAAHQWFLLFRDITNISFVLIIAITVTGCFYLNYNNYYQSMAIICSQYFLCMFAARNAGNRFVQNVLALESLST